MAGIVKSTRKRLVVNKRVREIETPTAVLDTALFFSDAVALGASVHQPTFTSELNRLPMIVKNEAVLALVNYSINVGIVQAFNGDTKSVDLLSFQRSSSATSFRADGLMVTNNSNVPRVHSDPGLMQLKGFMFEPASTNLFTDSGILDGLSSFTTRSSNGLTHVDSDFAIGDLLTKGMKFENIVTGDTFAYKAIANSVVGKNYTFSFFVKMSDGTIPTRTDMSLVIGGSRFEIDSAISKITSCGKGVYRIEIVRTSLTETFTAGVVKYKSQSTKTFVVSGYQLEEGNIATSYIPTTTASATRLADKLTDMRPLSVFPFNSWYMESDLFTGWFGNGVDRLTQLGRNYTPKSKYIKKTLSVAAINILNANVLEYETWYTISFDYNILNENDTVDAFLIYLDKTVGYALKNGGPKGKSSYTFKIDNSFNPNSLLRLYGGKTALVSNANEVEFTNVKLEKGSVATPWSIAPEDIMKINANGNVEVSSDVPVNIRSLSLVARELNQSEV